MKAITTRQIIEIRVALSGQIDHYKEMAEISPEYRDYYARRIAETRAIHDLLGEINDRVYSSPELKTRISCKL